MLVGFALLFAQTWSAGEAKPTSAVTQQSVGANSPNQTTSGPNSPAIVGDGNIVGSNTVIVVQTPRPQPEEKKRTVKQSYGDIALYEVDGESWGYGYRDVLRLGSVPLRMKADTWQRFNPAVAVSADSKTSLMDTGLSITLPVGFTVNTSESRTWQVNTTPTQQNGGAYSAQLGDIHPGQGINNDTALFIRSSTAGRKSFQYVITGRDRAPIVKSFEIVVE